MGRSDFEEQLNSSSGPAYSTWFSWLPIAPSQGIHRRVVVTELQGYCDSRTLSPADQVEFYPPATSSEETFSNPPSPDTAEVFVTQSFASSSGGRDIWDSTCLLFTAPSLQVVISSGIPGFDANYSRSAVKFEEVSVKYKLCLFYVYYFLIFCYLNFIFYRFL